LAVAYEFSSRVSEGEVIFSGTKQGLENRIVPQAGFRLELLRVLPLRGGGVLRKAKGLSLLIPAVMDAAWLLRRVRPRVVMGVGGYVSGPLLATAGISRIPSLILEPNAVPGLTNRWLSPLVDAAAVAWDETRAFFGAKGFLSGNPVREEITRVPLRPVDKNLHLLVIGGSQGSRVLSQAMVSALYYLKPYRDRITVTHQIGRSGEAESKSIRDAYRQEGFTAQVEPYLEAMEKEYSRCDLVVSRAGATTCAELAAAGRPSVLIPLPLAGGHQRQNAEMMERRGAARVLPQEDLSGERLAHMVVDLLGAPEKRREMAERAKTLARPEAARIIVDRLLELAGSSGEVRP